MRTSARRVERDRAKCLSRIPTITPSSASGCVDRVECDTGGVTAVPPARRRSRHLFCRWRSPFRWDSRSRLRRRLARVRSLSRQHSGEHVFWWAAAEDFGRNRSLQARHRRDRIFFLVRMAARSARGSDAATEITGRQAPVPTPWRFMRPSLRSRKPGHFSRAGVGPFSRAPKREMKSGRVSTGKGH